MFQKSFCSYFLSFLFFRAWLLKMMKYALFMIRFFVWFQKQSHLLLYIFCFCLTSYYLEARGSKCFSLIIVYQLRCVISDIPISKRSLWLWRQRIEGRRLLLHRHLRWHQSKQSLTRRRRPFVVSCLSVSSTVCRFLSVRVDVDCRMSMFVCLSYIQR